MTSTLTLRFKLTLVVVPPAPYNVLVDMSVHLGALLPIIVLLPEPGSRYRH